MYNLIKLIQIGECMSIITCPDEILQIILLDTDLSLTSEVCTKFHNCIKDYQFQNMFIEHIRKNMDEADQCRFNDYLFSIQSSTVPLYQRVRKVFQFTAEKYAEIPPQYRPNAPGISLSSLNLMFSYLNNAEHLDQVEKIKTSSPLKPLNINAFIRPIKPEIRDCKKVDFSEKKYYTLTRGITQICNLTDLSLHKNNLTRIPLELLELTKLKILDFSQNRLTSLPPEITALTNLTVLDINSNQFRSVPEELFSLHPLRIYFNSNPLQSLPRNLMNRSQEIIDRPELLGLESLQVYFRLEPNKQKLVQDKVNELNLLAEEVDAHILDHIERLEQAITSILDQEFDLLSVELQTIVNTEIFYCGHEPLRPAQGILLGMNLVNPAWGFDHRHNNLRNYFEALQLAK